MLAGGIPDILAPLTGTNDAFTHDGSLGIGGTLAGGDGYDTLDYRYVDGPVTVRVAADTMTSIERIFGTALRDTFVLAGSFSVIDAPITRLRRNSKVGDHLSGFVCGR